MALAHTLGSKVEVAYNRGDLLEKRRGLMQVWSDFLYMPSERTKQAETGFVAG